MQQNLGYCTKTWYYSVSLHRTQMDYLCKALVELFIQPSSYIVKMT